MMRSGDSRSGRGLASANGVAAMMAISATTNGLRNGPTLNDLRLDRRWALVVCQPDSAHGGTSYTKHRDFITGETPITRTIPPKFSDSPGRTHDSGRCVTPAEQQVAQFVSDRTSQQHGGIGCGA